MIPTKERRLELARKYAPDQYNKFIASRKTFIAGRLADLRLNYKYAKTEAEKERIATEAKELKEELKYYI